MLITVFENIPVVSHIVIAEHTQNEHRSIRLLIDKHIADFEEFGRVSFEMTAIKNIKNKVNEAKIFYLNEQQATLLMTYLKNTVVVREFKKALVKAFYDLKQGCNEPLSYSSLERENIELKRAVNRMAKNLKEIQRFNYVNYQDQRDFTDFLNQLNKTAEQALEASRLFLGYGNSAMGFIERIRERHQIQ